MSQVFYVNSDDVDGESSGQTTTTTGTQTEAQAALNHFWPKVTDEIRKIVTLDLKNQALPLARIKKIMKLDDDVKMISAEAPMLFAKAAEIFIHELTLRAWVHTEDNKRRTLQRNDIAMAITKFDQFDFLIDIVPRDEVKPAKAADSTVRTTSMNPDQVHYYFQLAQQHQAALQQTTQQSNATTLQLVQPLNVSNSEQNATTSNPPQQVIQLQQAAPVAQPVQQTQTAAIQIVQQVVGPNGEIQNIPITLTPQQMQMIRLQMQGNSSQPIVIQAPQTIQQNSNQQQIIQVTQQTQPTPVYLTQANSGTETE